MQKLYSKLVWLALLLIMWQPASASFSNKCLNTIGASSRHVCVKMLQLLAEPEKYNNQRVIVSGFLDLSGDGTGDSKLYFHREGFKFMLLQNSLDIDLFGTYKLKLNGSSVWVEGVYIASGSDPMQLSLGIITRIDNIYKHDVKRRNVGSLLKVK